MIADDPHLSLRLAGSERDLRAAQRLRYRVFVEELGGDGALVDHRERLEVDAFDAICDHLLLVDRRRDAAALDDVVGVYRLLPGERAAGGRFYSAGEYDLTPLLRSGRRLLELGRSCVHADFRGGPAIYLLWGGLADYVAERGAEVLFGTASFPGTDPAALAGPLAYLRAHHLAPEDLRVRARGAGGWPPPPAGGIDRRGAMLAMPPLIKAYLRLGGMVGEGVWIDHDFNTTDVCLVLDTQRMSARHRALYGRQAVA